MAEVIMTEVVMTEEHKEKELMLAVAQMDYEKLIDFAMKNKSKKFDLSFKAMMQEMSDEEYMLMWEQLYTVLEEKVSILLLPEDTNKSINKQNRNEIVRFLIALIDMGIAHFDTGKSIVCKGLLNAIVHLNGKILLLPASMDPLANRISYLCERMFLARNMYQIHFCYNSIVYLLRRSQDPKLTKREVKRLYALRFFIPMLLESENVDVIEVIEYVKSCTVNPKFISMPEGRKIIRIVLCGNGNYIQDIHEAIEKDLKSCTMDVAVAYGKLYSSAWIHALKHEKTSVLEGLQFMCLQRIILLATEAHKNKLMENCLKLLAQFHSLKKEASIAKMLYTLYQPIIWRCLKSDDGVVRANATQIFLDVFPMEDPDEIITRADAELTDQMLAIKDLLTDECILVRIRAINGLCAAIMINWELFTEDMLRTYFCVLVNDCGTDSASYEVRLAVVKGLKTILENPMSYNMMKKILPKCYVMFDDANELVRLAFVHLLIRVNKIKSIKYYDIVPVDDLLEKLGSDRLLAKPLVLLMKNSYFPNGEGPEMWLPRCIEMVKKNPVACNVFFHHIPSYISLNETVQFMRFTVESIHYYVLSAVESKKKRASSTMKEVDLEQIGLQDHFVVSGLLNGISIMWLMSRPLLEEEENKQLLKMIVSKFLKCLGNLLLYYKDTIVWDAVYFLASQMPSSSIPSLASLCFFRLKALPEDCEEEEYVTLVECLCSQESVAFMELLNEWIEKGLAGHLNIAPKSKKRKSKKDAHHPYDDEPKPILARRMLYRALEMRSSQKALLVVCPEKLKETLHLMAPLQRRIEMSTGKEIKDTDFLRHTHHLLLKIAVLLESEEQFDIVKYLEGLLEWYYEKLFEPLVPNSNHNSTWRSASTNKLQKALLDLRELSLGIFQDLLSVMKDVTLLVELKSTNFLKFALSLLPLDGVIILPVCRFLRRHICIRLGYHVIKNCNTLNILPDCFSKIFQQLNNKEFYESIPVTDIKEIQMVLSDCLSLMHGVNEELNELLSSITHCILKGICSHMDTIELKKENIFEKSPFSALINMHLGILSTKPQIAVFFLKQLQNLVSRPEMNIRNWVSYLTIVKTIWESKKSKTVEGELLVLLNKMDGFVNAPLKTLDTNIPQGEPNDKDSAKSFEDYCLVEYKKLKDNMAPKIRKTKDIV